MNLEVDDDKKAEIANVITSPDSPVGIDAKKTHIIIINKFCLLYTSDAADEEEV